MSGVIVGGCLCHRCRKVWIENPPRLRRWCQVCQTAFRCVVCGQFKPAHLRYGDTRWCLACGEALAHIRWTLTQRPDLPEVFEARVEHYQHRAGLGLPLFEGVLPEECLVRPPAYQPRGEEDVA